LYSLAAAIALLAILAFGAIAYSGDVVGKPHLVGMVEPQKITEDWQAKELNSSTPDF
jgi:hypothetical protein